MALIEMDFAIGGGSDQGILLWENPNPTSILESYGNVQLSDSLDNYTKIAIEFYNRNQTIDDVQRLEAKVSTIPMASSSATYNALVTNAIATGSWSSSGSNCRVWARGYNDNTKLAQCVITSGSAFTPLKIYGIK